MSPLINTGRATELVGKKRDGSEFPVELILSSYTIDDKPMFVVVVHDTTYRRGLQKEANF